jgi:hypothetical protein
MAAARFMRTGIEDAVFRAAGADLSRFDPSRNYWVSVTDWTACANKACIAALIPVVGVTW